MPSGQEHLPTCNAKGRQGHSGPCLIRLLLESPGTDLLTEIANQSNHYSNADREANQFDPGESIAQFGSPVQVSRDYPHGDERKQPQ